MLIKLRIGFYQVECDAFANLATELLDIQPNFRRATSPGAKGSVSQSPALALFAGGDLKKELISFNAVAI